MGRIALLILQYADVILPFIGASIAYLLNLDPRKVTFPAFAWLSNKLESWNRFRERHEASSTYVMLVLTVVSAMSSIPLIEKRLPSIRLVWDQAWQNHASLASWMLLVFALGVAFGLFLLRQRALKAYAYLEILVGISVVWVTAFDMTTSRTSTGAKIAGSVYAIIRGLVNLTEQPKPKDVGNDTRAA